MHVTHAYLQMTLFWNACWLIKPLVAAGQSTLVYMLAPQLDVHSQ